MKREKIDLPGLSLGLSLVAWPAVVALCLWLASCTSSTASTGPNEPAAAVVGNWAAAWPDTGAQLGLVSMSLAAGGAYQVTIDAKGVPVERETGAWVLRASRVVFSPATCEAAGVAGAALVLVACAGAYSIPIDIRGSAWSVAYTAGGQLSNVTFHRL